ncbi:hypothetical protein LZG04_25865 [Saccharothrix sp. S26]|uniref:hypothetical protein n=1 Tax=Saccharothrix sp. S26 TaxID=2907215 RepID=UPI001F2D33F2|nr:hypothetical protein [Saccharothrix sp. S26]MCE6998198.1 hypothetical protein [Saccharothrix sp. S26]
MTTFGQTAPAVARPEPSAPETLRHHVSALHGRRAGVHSGPGANTTARQHAKGKPIVWE